MLRINWLLINHLLHLVGLTIIYLFFLNSETWIAQYIKSVFRGETTGGQKITGCWKDVMGLSEVAACLGKDMAQWLHRAPWVRNLV
jgi:hypothetical protein